MRTRCVPGATTNPPPKDVIAVSGSRLMHDPPRPRRLRRPPARALRVALMSPLVGALLQSTLALRSSVRRATASAELPRPSALGSAPTPTPVSTRSVQDMTPCLCIAPRVLLAVGKTENPLEECGPVASLNRPTALDPCGVGRFGQ